MIGLEEYSRIKNNYCLCYFGLSAEYPVILEMLRPIIESNFPGLNFYICCRDELLKFLNDREKTFGMSALKEWKPRIAQFRELSYDSSSKHPVETFLNNCGITNFTLDKPVPVKTRKCTIITQGTFPTRSLSRTQIDRLRKMAVCKGLEPVIDESWEGSGWVTGVESVGLFRALDAGIPVSLVPNGIGASLVKKMVPVTEILNVT